METPELVDSVSNTGRQKEEIHIDKPSATDGLKVNALIQRCPPLDTNSVYCNLLQCEYFAATSAVAKSGNRVVGFTSGFMKPSAKNELFLWQVAVDATARGQGLALKMISHILAREGLRDITYLETTISPGNTASERLFASLAQRLNIPIQQTLKFSKAENFNNQHDDEILHRLGPIPPP